jgi:hypothetical protein
MGDDFGKHLTVELTEGNSSLLLCFGLGVKFAIASLDPGLIRD